MACVKFRLNPGSFNSWRLYENEGPPYTQLISRYASQPGRDIHLPAVSMVLYDYVNFGFNVPYNPNNIYGYNPKSMEEWIDLVGADIEDEDGNTIVCGAEYGKNADFDPYTNQWGNLIYEQGYTCEFFTRDGQYFPVKCNHYPFNVGDCTKYIRYYCKDNMDDKDSIYYLGDVYFLLDRLQVGISYDVEEKGPLDPMLEDGDQGGWFYGDTFEVYLGFGDVIEVSEWFQWGFKFKIRGVREEFRVVNLDYRSSGLPSDLPCIRQPEETNGYCQIDQYYRKVKGINSNPTKWDYTFCMTQYDDFKEWLEIVQQGKEAYDAEYGPFSARANRKELANQRPVRAARIQRREEHEEHHNHGHDHNHEHDH